MKLRMKVNEEDRRVPLMEGLVCGIKFGVCFINNKEFYFSILSKRES